MIFDVFRYATGVTTGGTTTALPHDPARVTAALESPNCVGVVAQFRARNAWDAIERGGNLIATFQCTLGPRGREIQALNNKKGGVH